jgi:hypothetical protein
MKTLYNLLSCSSTTNKKSIIYHIIPRSALHWAYVSKEWSEVAFWNLTCDSCVSFTKVSICQAAMMGRTCIVGLHLQDTNFSGIRSRRACGGMYTRSA